jgi:PTH1 family peptidyl-tRNA hydrolase
MEDILQPRLKAIIGLGNPGTDYNDSRHNLGFEVVDRLAGKTKFKAGRGRYFFCEISVTSRKIVLLKPTTFMNRSGLAMGDYIAEASLNPGETLVIADDFNLPFGLIRLRRSGSDGGHKGLASIIYHLGSQEFPRLRLGVGPVPENASAEEFVLGKMGERERDMAAEMVARASEAAVMWVTEGYDIAAARFNRASDEN